MKRILISVAACLVFLAGSCAWLAAPTSETTPKATPSAGGGFDITTPVGVIHVDKEPELGKPVTGKLKDGTTYTWTPPPAQAPKTNWDALVGVVSQTVGAITTHPEVAFAILAAGKLAGEAAGIGGGPTAPLLKKKPEEELEVKS